MNATAVILLGGKGTRIASLYPDRPKALVPVAGRTILEWQFDWLARAGLTRIHLAAGHMADVLGRWLHERSDDAGHGLRRLTLPPLPEAFNPKSEIRNPHCLVSLSMEPHPLGTGGGLKFVEPWIGTDGFWVFNGDSLLPCLDVAGMESAAAAHPGEWASLAATHVDKPGRFGTVEFDGNGRLTAFLEKTERLEGWVNGGVYRADRRLLDRIEPDRFVSLETDIFPALAEQGLLRAVRCPPPLLDMGTPDGLAAMESFLRAP